MRRLPWISIAIVLLALALRLILLGMKPAHFDEGVNGWFVDQMTRQGFYHYDPTNFHGPLHFYVLFLAQTLLGRHEWVLRLPLALASTACVAMMLSFRAYLGERVCQWAAAAMAVSPGFVFYGRYAIHETWLVFFLLLLMWGLVGLCHRGSRTHLWAAALGLAGTILTKETYLIHALCLALGYGTLLWLERYSPSAPFARAAQVWTRRDLLQAAAISLGIVLLIYSGFLLDCPSVFGLLRTFGAWAQTGMQGNSGHEKVPWYWFDLLARYEWPALLGLVASVGSLWPNQGRSLRWMAISASGTLVAYTLVSYKTPWCLISIAWPFLFVFGAAIQWAARNYDRWVASGLGALVLLCSLSTSLSLNFRDYTKEDEPYVYVQTLPDINKLLDPLRTLAKRDPVAYHLPGYILLPDTHPLLWLLGDFTQVNFISLSELPEDLSAAEFFVVAEEFVEEVEHSIQGEYFREKIVIRGNSGASQMLYFRAATFAGFFPGRHPEFTGPTPKALQKETPEKSGAK